MKLKVMPLSVVLLASCAIAIPTFAQTAPEDAYDYRRSVMKSLGSHTRAFFLIFSGKVDQSTQMSIHANAISAISAEISTLFPAGSNVDDSSALPLIWEEPEQFSEVAQNAKIATARLAAAVANGDRQAVAQGFRALGNACKGCHDRYREDDD